MYIGNKIHSSATRFRGAGGDRTEKPSVASGRTAPPTPPRKEGIVDLEMKISARLGVNDIESGLRGNDSLLKK